MKVLKDLAGAEDILLDAELPDTVIQSRGGSDYTITKVNAKTIPYAGTFGQPGAVYIKDKLDGIDNSLDLRNSVSRNTIADLKLETGIVFNTINVLGYYEKGDGGGGTFYWDATSTEADNGGTIIQATGITTGRWKRVFSGAVNVKWFGAKGDGVADDTTAIQNASNVGDILQETSDIFRITGRIEFKHNVDFNGSIFKLDIANTITVGGISTTSATNLKNFTIDCTLAPEVNQPCLLDMSSVNDTLVFSNIHVLNPKNTNPSLATSGILLYKSSSATALGGNFTIQNCSVTNVIGASAAKGIIASFNGEGVVAIVTIDNCTVDTVFPAADGDCFHVASGTLYGTDTTNSGQATIKNCIAKSGAKRAYKVQYNRTLVDNCIAFVDMPDGISSTLQAFATYAANTVFRACKVYGSIEQNTSAGSSMAIEGDNCIVDSFYNNTKASAVGIYITKGNSRIINSNIINNSSSVSANTIMYSTKYAFGSIDNTTIVSSSANAITTSSTLTDNTISISTSNIRGNIKTLAQSTSALIIDSCEIYGAVTTAESNTSSSTMYMSNSKVVSTSNAVNLNSVAPAKLSNCCIIHNNYGVFGGNPLIVNGCTFDGGLSVVAVGIRSTAPKSTARFNEISNCNIGIQFLFSNTSQIVNGNTYSNNTTNESFTNVDTLLLHTNNVVIP